MKILCACEESQAVTIELRKLGHEAYSCDLEPCSGGYPAWHIQEDALETIGEDDWDLLIAFPPCTHLCVSGARHFEAKRKDGRQQAGIDFFMAIANAPIDKIAIENPVGIMSSEWREPDQIIQPYYFGDPVRKTTCLWLKNLRGLVHYEHDEFFHKQTWVEPEIHTCANGSTFSQWDYDIACMKPEVRAGLRSKTFTGIAKQMAIQWGGQI